MVAYWPLAVGLGVLVAAAVLNQVNGRVPNLLSLGMIGAAWLAALFIQCGLAPTSGGGLAASVICTFAALAVLVPDYAIGCVPAGCVKAQMAFAAWIGCALGLGPALTATIIATLAGELVTAAAVALYKIRQNSQAPELYQRPIDLIRPPALFPIQTTLSAGSLLGIAAAALLGYVA
ncbi:MAG TPA: hypothetical protein VFB80_07315 [Pirellulaceae bacterium]|nr:hypothetical protein [Pirellulaceae bacterium]